MTTPTSAGVYYDPYDTVVGADPHPAFRRLREEAPLYYNEHYDFYALSRFADVERVLTARKGATMPSARDAREWTASGGAGRSSLLPRKCLYV